jgi:hypothetical protein
MAFLGLSSGALLALGVLLVFVLLLILGLSSAAKRGQRPWDEIVREAEERRLRRLGSLVHYVPFGSGITSCCRRTPFELPRTDRLTSVPGDVTCRGDRP